MNLRLSLIALAFAFGFLPSRAAEGPNNAPVETGKSKVLRVACVGDSITEGVGATGGWAWPFQLDRMLDEKWNVRNFGKSYSTAWKQARRPYWNWPEFKQSKAFCPDVVVIALGTNDAAEWETGAGKDFAKDYKALIGEYQKLPSKPRVFCCTPLWTTSKERAANLPEINRTIERLAAETSAGLIDLQRPSADKKGLFPDGLHPNDEGNALVARAVYRALTGAAWSGEVPPPSGARKDKPAVVTKDNPGELTYAEVCALLLAEPTLTAEQRRAVAEKYRTTAPELEFRHLQSERQAAEAEKLRGQFKKSDAELYGKYRGVAHDAVAQSGKLHRQAITDLIATVPPEQRAGFGAAWLERYIFDRLLPVAPTLTAGQKDQIRALCARRGAAYGKIDNTPERGIEGVEAYKAVYQTILGEEQRRRVEDR